MFILLEKIKMNQSAASSGVSKGTYAPKSGEFYPQFPDRFAIGIIRPTSSSSLCSCSLGLIKKGELAGSPSQRRDGMSKGLEHFHSRAKTVMTRTSLASHADTGSETRPSAPAKISQLGLLFRGENLANFKT